MRTRYYIIALILALIVLLAPHFTRHFIGNSTMPGALSYQFERYSSEKGIFFSDDSSYTSDYSISYLSPQTFVIGLLGQFIGSKDALFFIQILLGLIAVYLFIRILEELNVKENVIFLSVIFFITSSSFILTFSVASYIALPIVITLLAYILSRKNVFISALCYSLLPFFGIVYSLIGAIVIIVSGFRNKKEKFGSMQLNFLAISSLIVLIPYYNRFAPFILDFSFSLDRYFKILGGTYGISMISFLLCSIGFIFLWRQKEENNRLFLGAILLFVLSLFFEESLAIFNFGIAYLSAIALVNLNKIRWQLISVKRFSVIVIFVTLLFSFTNNIIEVSNYAPIPNEAKALLWMKYSIPTNAIVLSSVDNGFLIESIAKRKAFIDDSFIDSSFYELRESIVGTIFNSRSLSTTYALLKENNIGYIFIDSEMMNGKVWNKNNEGLLFLFRNSEIFKNVYKDDNIWIWKVNLDLPQSRVLG